MTLAALICEQDAPALTALRRILPLADRRRLSAEDLRRIDAYHGGAIDLHALLPAVLPLLRPRWWECEITAQHGTAMQLGYLATPAEDGIGVTFVGHAAAFDRLLGPIAAVITATGMSWPTDTPDAAVRELRAAAGIVLRALLLDVGASDD